MQRNMNPWNRWKSWCANRNKQPSTLFFIRKFRKVVGHLNKGENDKFTKAIFFFLRGDPYSKTKTITSGRRCNLDDGESSQIPCKLKLVGHQSLSTYCKMNLSEWKKFKLRNYDAKYIFFFTFCSAQCFNPIQDELLRGCSRMGRGERPSSLKSATHTLQWWNLAQLHLT